jgi:hypothetical protein
MADMAGGGISNWSLFNLCPAAQCALVLQDMDRFNTIMYSPCGVMDHWRLGYMNDGWWYEMSLAYNLGTVSVSTSMALAAQAFGIDLLHTTFSPGYAKTIGLRPFEQVAYQGMSFDKAGPTTNNSMCLKNVWDGIVAYPDYRGVMFGMGDGHEQRVSGGAFELAYYAYRDPAYAAVVKTGGQRDLLYGVPELPADPPVQYAKSTHSDNAGLALLRSQTAGREQRDQIQAVVTYGTHGGYHGHFDHTDMVSLMRYGRSFFNPETSWYGYGSYMYKMWVQTSLAHNMVVVDKKMKEPTDCTPLLFHSGPMMQAFAVDATSRWSNPPYLGGYEQVDAVKAGDAPYVPIPANHPVPGDVTGYTEPVTQRRLMVVTDDYVLLFDYLKATKTHDYDNLLHLRGARPPASSDTFASVGHDAELSSDPLSSAQFITNADHYSYSQPFTVASEHWFAEQGGDGKNVNRGNWETGGSNQLYNSPGVLRIDEHVLWPASGKFTIADYPECWSSVFKKLSYSVDGDGKSLANGTFKAWNLGQGTVDIDITGIKQLTLATDVAPQKGAVRKSIFWANAMIVTADGRQIPLSSLAGTKVNIVASDFAGKDYEGGPVRIAGNTCTDVIAAEPQDSTRPATIAFDLSSLNAVRLKAVVGGDWPIGDESQLRKVCDVQYTGTSANFVTLVEPYESASTISSAVATSPNVVRVGLIDGRSQEIRVSGLDSENATGLVATITEFRGGRVSRVESTEVSN